MSSRLLALVAGLLLAWSLAPGARAQAFFNVSFQKASATDDSIQESVSGFPPARDCSVPCQTAHYVCRIINCSSVDADGNCLTPYPDPVTNGLFIDTPPATLPVDCARGVSVTGSGTFGAVTCDAGTNTVRVENINIPPGGNLIISFWCAINCDEGAVTNTATFDYDQNGSGAPRQAKDPLSPFGAPGLTVRVGNPSTAGITKDAPSLPIQNGRRIGQPGTSVPFIIEATNSNCTPYDLSEIFDIAQEAGCVSADCSTLRLYIDDVPSPLPAGTQCPGASPRLFTFGPMTVQPHQVIRIEYDGVFTRSPPPGLCCNIAYFQVAGGPLVYSSDPGLESSLSPEQTCTDLNFGVAVIGDAVKRAEDAAGNEITSVKPGDEVYWRFSIENQGGDDFIFDMTDTFPPEVILGPGAIVTPFPDGTCSIVGQVLTCTGVTAPASSTVEMLVRSSIDCTGVSGGTDICNEAVITSPTLPQPLTTHCPSCIGSAPYNRTCVTLEAPNFEFASKEVADDSGNGLVLAGETLHYTIKALNSGTSDATGVIVRDTLPAGLTYLAGTLVLDGVSLTDAADGDAGEVVAGVITVRIPVIAPLAFGVGQITFDARLDTPTGPNACNGATVEYAEAALCGLGIQTVPEACIPVESPTGPPQLSAVKSVTPSGAVPAGTQLHYTIGTCNGVAGGMATNVVVTDVIPAGTTYVPGSMLLAGLSVSDAADGDGGTLLAGPPESVSFALGDMVTGQCLIADFDVLIDPAAAGIVSNVAQYVADGVPAADTNTVTTPIGGGTNPPQISLTKTSSLPGGLPLRRGDVIEYSVKACNDAAAGPAQDLNIADAIPLDALTLCGGVYVPGSIMVDGVPQTDAADGDIARYDAAPAPGGVVADVRTLDPGTCVTLTFDVTVNAGCDDAERVLNQATASATGGASVASNQTSDAVTVSSGTEICDNGLDDDGDADIDCADADCAGAPNCVGLEICDNGLDDDGDADIDCADADCVNDPNCQGAEPNLMRKAGLPLANRCTAMPAPCGCEVGNRLDPVADDCVTAGTCTQVDAVTWLVPGDLQVSVPLVFYEVNGAGCEAAGDPNHLVVRKSGPSDIQVLLTP